MGKKISITFEETEAEAGGMGFNVYLDGIDDERRKVIDAMDPETQLKNLSTAEFWALRCFQITMNVMMQSGAIKKVTRRT